MHEAKMSISAKGKAREDAHWQLGWWDLHALMESPSRPIAWSKSSVIFTPDLVQPLVLARHFPSSRQFILPYPTPWATTLGAYEPPSIISISPTDDWLFAYFPGNGGDGAGCLWRRHGQLDNWILQEWWTFAKGAGAVAAEWTCTDREWALSEQDQPYRLPPRGPFLQSNLPTLIIVTQTHQVHVCLVPSPLSPLKILKTSLLHASITMDSQAHTQGELPTSTRGGQKVCVKAAIGFNYNDSVILVATRSHLLPPHTIAQIPFNTMDLGLHLEMTEPGYQSDSLIANEWERWGEEPTIDLSTLQIRRVAFGTAIKVWPTPTIRRPGSRLTDLRFCAIPPDIVPPSPTITRDPRRPVKDNTSEKGTMYLVASFLDFDDYTSLPKSEITTFPLIRGKAAEVILNSKLERTRTFDVGTVAFLAPSPSPKRIVVGFLDSSGTIRTHTKSKEVSIGSMIVINPVDLTTDDQWDIAHILSPYNSIGRDVPLNAVVSPNRSLICSISPSTTLAARTVVHALPRSKHGISLGPPRDDLARAVVLSILSRTTPSDIIHALTTAIAPLDDVLKTLYNSLRILESHSFGLQDMWIEEILGIATEVYLGRAQRVEAKAEKRALEEWGRTAHELTSVVALNAAFEDCREGDAYDLEAVWQLVGLSLWFIKLLEQILKQCVHVANDIPAPKEDKPRLDVPSLETGPPVGISVLLHLLHPYAVGNLHAALQHVKRLRDDMNSLSPKSENAQMAKDVFMDGVEGSGIYLDALEPVLLEISKEVSKIAAEVLKKGLVNCTLTPALQQHARPVVQKVLALEVMDRVRLFIKPSDLVDGMSKLVVEEKLKEEDNDVVSKGVLLHTGVRVQCVRCNGQSEIGGQDNVAGHVSQRWNAWERVWATRCICGGAWIRRL